MTISSETASLPQGRVGTDVDPGELWTVDEARAGHDFDPATGHFPEMDDDAPDDDEEGDVGDVG